MILFQTLGLSAGAGALFGCLVAQKGAYLRGIGALPSEALRPLIPIAARARPVLAGSAFGVAVALQIGGAPMIGALALVGAMALATHRPVRSSPAPRGPGAWLPMRADEVFPRAAHSGWLDAGTPAGRRAAVCCATGLVVAGALLARFWPDAPYCIALNALALVPLFATGVRAQLPPHNRAGIELLMRHYFEALGKDRTLRLTPLVRIPCGAREPDELRLLAQPRAALPGLLGIEVGIAYVRDASGYVRVPEVLVRVQQRSPAAVKVGALVSESRLVAGRKSSERVYRAVLEPPTVPFIVTTVGRLSRALSERRTAVVPAWQGPERRRSFAHAPLPSGVEPSATPLDSRVRRSGKRVEAAAPRVVRIDRQAVPPPSSPRLSSETASAVLPHTARCA